MTKTELLLRLSMIRIDLGRISGPDFYSDCTELSLRDRITVAGRVDLAIALVELAADVINGRKADAA